MVHGFYNQKMYPISAVLERVKEDGVFHGGPNSVCGDFYIVWGSLTKRQTVNRLALFVESST